MQYIGGYLYIIYIEQPLFFSFSQDFTKKLYFVVVEILSHCFYTPDITEKIGTERTITVNCHFNNIKMCSNHSPLQQTVVLERHDEQRDAHRR